MQFIIHLIAYLPFSSLWRTSAVVSSFSQTIHTSSKSFWRKNRLKKYRIETLGEVFEFTLQALAKISLSCKVKHLSVSGKEHLAVKRDCEIPYSNIVLYTSHTPLGLCSTFSCKPYWSVSRVEHPEYRKNIRI